MRHERVLYESAEAKSRRGSNGMMRPQIMAVSLVQSPLGFGLDWKLVHYEYSNYKILRRDLVNRLVASQEGELTVLRSRRGQVGEWFEKWRLNSKCKAELVEEGWQ